MNDNWGVGNKADAKAFATALVGNTIVELIQGEHPHSRSDNNIYARFPGGRIEEFDGHRTLVTIHIEESNYMKESELSGDEIRQSCYGRIFFDHQPVYEVGGRTASNVLNRISAKLSKLKELSVRPWETDCRGRKIYYREVPAVITRYIGDQGCFIIEPAAGLRFPPMPYDVEEGKEPYDDTSAKVEIDSPHIWWWRAKLTEQEATGEVVDDD